MPVSQRPQCASQRASQRKPPRHSRCVTSAVPDQRVQARIAGQHLPRRAGRGVAVEHDGDVFAQAGEHGRHFPISDSFAQLLPRQLVDRPNSASAGPAAWPGRHRRRRVCVHSPTRSSAIRGRARTTTPAPTVHLGGTMSPSVPLLAAALALRPRSPCPRRAGGHAQGPPLLAAGGDAAVDAARAVVRQDRQGFGQPDEVPDLPGDAARRHAAAAHRPGEGRRRRHRLDAARLHGRPLPADGGVRAAVHVAAAPRRPARPRGTTTRSTANKEFPGIKALAVNVHDNGYVHTRRASRSR